LSLVAAVRVVIFRGNCPRALRALQGVRRGHRMPAPYGGTEGKRESRENCAGCSSRTWRDCCLPLRRAFKQLLAPTWGHHPHPSPLPRRERGSVGRPSRGSGRTYFLVAVQQLLIHGTAPRAGCNAAQGERDVHGRVEMAGRVGICGRMGCEGL